jgi:hypothetical protein
MKWLDASVFIAVVGHGFLGPLASAGYWLSLLGVALYFTIRLLFWQEFK